MNDPNKRTRAREAHRKLDKALALVLEVSYTFTTVEKPVNRIAADIQRMKDKVRDEAQ